MARGILVPLDGSALAAAAIPYALELAHRFDAEIVLAHIVDAEPRERETSGEARARAWAEAEARLEGRRLEASAGGQPVRVALDQGAPATALLDAARAHDSALIAMATHGRSGPSRWAMGSVAEQLLRLTHLPTLLLTPRSIEAGGPERLRQRALVPLDGSELSERILPYVTTLGGGLRVPLTLLQVVDPVRLSSYAAADPYGAAAALWPELLKAAQDSARVQLERCAATLAAAGLAADTLVEMGPTTDTIASTAQHVGAGWLAMASHGRGGLGGLVLGSTALAVLRHTALPVLLAAGPPLGRYQLGAAGEPGDAAAS